MVSNDLAQLYERHRPAFDRLSDLLLKWNQKINLTTITDPVEIAELHFMDSLAALESIVSRETIGQPLSVLDIGARAGFPGLPLKMAHPSLRLTLVDTVKKKCDFIKEAVRHLGLQGVEVLHARVNDKTPVEGPPFDVVISRAAFKLKGLIGLAHPNLKPKGVLIAMKGMEIDDEINECTETLRALGYENLREIPYQLPLSKKARTLVMVSRH